MLRSLTLSVAVARPPWIVYEFVHDVGTWPRWATGLCLAARREGFRPPGASDERRRDDARLVRGDLITLKSVLEAAG